MLGYPIKRICTQLLGDSNVRDWYAAMDNASYEPGKIRPYCTRCGASIGLEAVTEKGCAFCVNQPVHWQKIIRVGNYQPPLSNWVLNLKFHHGWRWGQMLGQLLAPHVAQLDCPIDRTVICPVPMHWYRRWERGYNQAQLIADEVGKHVNIPVMSLLKRNRYTPSQTRVVPSQRTVNVSQSVTGRKMDLKDWTVILLDDVKTSGATLNNCCRQLKTMGCKRIIAAVIAVADPRHDDFMSIDAPTRPVSDQSAKA
jgi:ComF family protein